MDHFRSIHIISLSLLPAVLTLLLLYQPSPSQAIILCDGDCMDNTELEICRPYNDSRTPLYVMAFFPCNTNTFRARGFTVAAQMAVRAVQRDRTLLPGYGLRLAFNNTQCGRLSATRAFISQIPERRHMIIGPGCSSGALTVAEISPFYNLTQISYTATAISFSDKRIYPNFLRTISSDNASIDTITAVVREYGWQQVAIVTEISVLYSNLTTELSRALDRDRVKVITNGLAFTGGENDPALVVGHLNTSGARVVILNVFEDSAREIFCLAYRRGMVYPRYLFISYYQYSEFWWTDPIRNSTNYPMPQCTVQDLTNAIYRSLAVDYFPMPTAEQEVNVTTDVGYNSPAEFWRDFEGNLSSLNYNRSEALRQARFVYDAVWAAAFALNETSRLLWNGTVGNTNLTLDNFDDDQFRGEINEVILNSTRRLQFRGVSGKVKFNEFGDREPTRQIFQYIYDPLTLVDPEDPNVETLDPFARVSEETGELVYEEGFSERTVFPEGVPQAVEVVTIHPALFGFYTFLACLGIIFAIVCLVFNLIFKKKQIVKLSSPYLNTLIILGIILFYIDVILFGVDKNVAPQNIVDVNCQATIWLATIGFSLLFGTMLAKTWRVYYIFKNVKLKKKPLKDWILFIIVSVIVAIDVVFLIFVSVDVWRLRLIPQLVFRQGGAVPLVVGVCTSDASTYWIPILLTYKCLYLIIGLWLATTTYRVKIKQLRDSKLIVACVVGITVVSLVLTLITFLLPTLPNATYGVIGSFIMILLTTVLFLLFGTRMIELYRNPSGEVDLKSGPGSEGKSSILANNISTTQDDINKIAELNNTIKSLKTQIEEAKQRKAGKAQEAGVGVVFSNSDLEQDMNAAGSVAHLLSPDHDEKEEEAGKNGIHVEMAFKQEESERDKNNVDTSNL